MEISDEDYDNLITFDYNGLQRLLRSRFKDVNKNLNDLKRDLAFLQEQQENRVAWEEVVIDKLNRLEKTIIGVPTEDQFIHMQTDFGKFKKNYADDIVGIHTTLGKT